jgi:type IV pilus assembly protein PilY1
MGWYFDLPVTNSIAERVNVDPTANSGIVAFAGNLPDSSACSPAGTSDTYTLAFATGKTVLTSSNNSTTLIASLTSSNLITEVVIQNVNGTLRVYTGDSGGNIVSPSANLSTTSGVKQLNWREVPLAD